jgi:putative membrane protein
VACSRIVRFVLVWLLNTVALLVVAYIVPGIHVQDLMAAIVAALVLGLVNAVIRPILVLLTLPVTVLTLGLFILVINGLMFQLAAWVVPGFEVAGFWWAVLGALVFSIITFFLAAAVQR